MFARSVVMTRLFLLSSVVTILSLPLADGAFADPLLFSTGNPDGRMAVASRPGASGVSEIEAADDFALTQASSVTSATFTGLIPTGSSVGDVRVEIYRIFPQDSNVGRTSGPPTFSTSQVPTRVNSPSDVALLSRDSASAELTFLTNLLSPSFTAANSVRPGGIHPTPGQTTGGDGAVTGQEVQFQVTFATPLSLAADHYFFVPQVQLDNGAFLWLSAPKPIVPPGTPFPAGITDLQGWTRDQFLDPDWLRVGTDIVGGTPAPTFNFVFSLNGTIPEPSALVLFLLPLGGLVLLRRQSRA